MAGSSQPAFDRSFREPRLTGNLAHALLLEVEGLEEAGFPRAETGQAPVEHRRVVPLLRDPVLALDVEIEILQGFRGDPPALFLLFGP